LKTVNINKSINFGGRELPLITGPCVIENSEHSLRMANAIKSIADKLSVPFIFKSSFDKANRTSIDSFRGPGLEEGLEILARVKQEIGVPIITDIHLPDQAEAIAQVADILQIPAFLCRQTDLLIAAAKTGKPINIKKGQFLSPWKVAYITKKVESTGNKNILITERGNSYGFDGLVVDMRSIPIIQKEAGYPVIFDGTHSAQMPGNSDATTGGLREYIPTLLKAAVAAGCSGIFMEVHDDVENAKSDAATQWPITELANLLIQLKRIRETVTVDG